ncbi:MAG: tetratricopeptide repeat protein [Oscillatoria princeps RMCB-10]|jgi:tetratricopeptide (TPR) repeat protein|nr:tetratricopeptide repeat protein [Oscillatoria princeps RMCB-10]
MDKQRLQDYLNLIQALFSCGSGEEKKDILNAHQNLIDEGLVWVMEQVAALLAQQGKGKAAECLTDVARRLAADISNSATAALREEYLAFLCEVLQATSDSNGNPEVVYPLLSANRDKLNDTLAELFASLATAKLLEIEPEQAPAFAEAFFDFSNLIAQFPLGNRASNLEMAIAGYHLALRVFTPDADNQKWAMNQSNLGLAYCYRIKGDKAENLEQAIECYRQALQVRTRDAFPQDWAATKSNLGGAYSYRIKGDKAENLEQAIECFRQALLVITREAFPQKWAMIQNNLGLAYSYRIKGDKAENLEQAIEYFRQALLEYTRDAFPQEWATIQNNLGNAYLYRIKGDKAENLEQAIECYRQALQVRTRDAFPQDWAATKSNLGLAYFYRIKGDIAENLELAIECHRQALLVRTRDAFPQDWAMTQTNLGGAYSDRIKGDKAENLELAIECCRQALLEYTRDAFPQKWAVAQNNLGHAYSNRIKGDKAENLELAIECYGQALLVRTRDAFPQQWAMTQNNLGSAYSDRIKGDKAENLEQAIEYYRQALLEYTRDAFSQYWAQIQYNMGSAYRDRMKGDKAENLEQAIECYRQALQVHTRDAFPQEWAMTQNSLGNAYSDRIKGDKAENLEQAIEYYRQALQVRTRDVFPQYWANTQANLGNAYCNRIKGDKAENLEQAIECYWQDLQVHTRDVFPQKWAATQNNLGLAYSDRIKGDKAENLEQAIEYYRQALQVQTRDAFSQDWAMTQNNLGIAYSERIKGDKAENLKQAIECYRQALQVDTRDAFPQAWAIDQNNLGKAYEKQGQIEEAIQCFQSALEIYTPATFPLECLRAGRNLGNMAFTAGRWREAMQGYAPAIDAVEESRSQAMSEERRQEIVSESIDIYQKMVQACINTGNLEKAFEYVERSRSKRLVDLMASKDLYAKGEIPPEAERLLEEFHKKQRQIDQLRGYNDTSTQRGMASATRSRAKVEEDNAEILALEGEKQEIWQQMRRLDAVLAGQIKVATPNIAALQQLIHDDKTALLSFYTTESDTHIFVLRKNQVDCHTCAGQGATLQDWIWDNWLQPYLHNNDAWIKNIGGFLGELASRLQLNDLIASHLQGIEELILIPHLLLHVIPFAGMPVGDPPQPPLKKGGKTEYLGDKFLIRYVPSCQVLEFCHKRPPAKRSVASQEYAIIENATEDLPCASFEGEQIAKLYQVPDERRLRGRRNATVAEYRRLVKQVEGLLSSHHAQSRLDNPLESVLVLGDGFITLGELLTAGWRVPDLHDVFLSCCETGIGLTKDLTDDILTIGFGFLCAGARSVVSTLWSVDDLATSLFSLFYHRHKQNLSRPEALRQAQEDLRSLSGSELAAKYEPVLSPLLAKQLQEAEGELKRAYAALKKAKKESPDAVEELQKEYSRCYDIKQKVEDRQKQLKSACTEEFPFSDLHYWSAFTCQGLR